MTALPAQTTRTWTGASNASWNTVGNWNPTGVPTLSDDAVFPATIPLTGSIITLPSGAQINNLTFNNSYTLQGGTLSLGADQNINVGSGLTVEISSNLLSAGVGSNPYLKKVGAGTLILSGNNSSYTRYMNVIGGVVRVMANNAVPGTYFHVTNASATVEQVGGVTIPSGKTIYLSGAASTDNPSFRSVSGSNIWGGALVLHNEEGDHVVGVDAGSTLRINGNVNQTGGPDNLVKVGGGVLELKGAGTYTGETRIMAGTLLANNTSGSATGSGLVRAIGGMLGGNGTIGGSVQVESGGTVSAGASPGKLTIQGNLAVQTGGTMLVEIGGYTQGGIGAGGYDWLSVGGSAVLQPNSILRVALWGGFEPNYGDTFYVLTASGGVSDLGIQLTPEGLRPAQYWTYGIQPWQGQGGGQVLFLTFSVPEPASGLLLVLGLLGLYFFGRRWKKSV